MTASRFSVWRIAFRLFWREWRTGESRLLFLALLVAGAAIAAVGFLTERVQQTLKTEAGALMGADLALIADHPWPDQWTHLARQAGLRVAHTATFPSMVLHDGRAKLSEIKAVDTAYPLLGALTLAHALRPEAARPSSGEVWLETRLAKALGASVGDRLQLGLRMFTVGAMLDHEPDRGMGFFGLAPRLMMAADDVADTGLIAPGARVTYRLLLAGEPQAVAAFRDRNEARLGRGERMEDLAHARPELSQPLLRAERFLRLTVLLAILLAGVAVFLAARRYQWRHRDTVAVLRSLGASQRQMTHLFAIQLLWLALWGGGMGALLGFALHGLILSGLGEVLVGMLGVTPSPFVWSLASLWPLALSVLVAAGLLLGFALPNVLRLRRVPALRVMRQGLEEDATGYRLELVLAGLVFAGMSSLLLDDARMGLVAALGWGALMALLAAGGRIGAWALVAMLRRVGGQAAWVGNSLARHRHWISIQVPALALGMMALLLLTVTRHDLMDAWQRALPVDAPNRFIVNVQPNERDAVADLLARNKVRATLQPMVRGRLLAINDQPVSAARYAEDERAQRLVEREFNLSWQVDLPQGNQVTAGRWFTAQDAGQPVVSIEAGLARTLGIAVGDQLRFQIEGQPSSWRVVGLRKLEWESMRANFFVLMPPGTLDTAPATYMSGFYLPAAQRDLTDQLVQNHPGISVVDLDAVLASLRALLDQLAAVLGWVFGLALSAGAVVLLTALQATVDTRRYEMGVLRALGAQKRVLRRVLLGELLSLGALAGLLAGLVASVLAPLVLRQLFTLEVAIHGWLIPVAMLAGGLFCLAVGWSALAGILNTPPMAVLRRAEGFVG